MDPKRLTNPEDFKAPLKHLIRFKDGSVQTTKMIAGFFSQLAQAYETFANNLQTITVAFNKELVKRVGTDKLAFSDSLSMCMTAIRDINFGFASKIKTQIGFSYVENTQALNTQIEEAVEKMNKFLSNLEGTRSQLKKIQENYYKSEDNVIKAQENLEKLAKDLKPYDQIQKAQEKIMNCKVEAEENKRLYKLQIDAINQCWAPVYSEYKKTFETFDKNEIRKDFLTREAVTKLVQLFTTLYPQEEKKIGACDLGVKGKEAEEKPVATPDLLKFLTNGSLDDVLQNKPVEPLVLFEPKKKIEEVIIMKLGAEDYTTFYGGTTESDLYYLLDFISVFLPRETKQKLPSQSPSMAAATNMNSSYMNQSRLNAFQRYELQQKSADFQQKFFGGIRKKSNAIDFPLEEAVEERVKQIITNRTNRKFLIDNLVAQKDPVTNNSRIKLQNKVFGYLCNYLSALVSRIIEDRDYELLSGFLPIINKYYTLKDSKIEYLYDFFKEQPMWTELDIWLEIVRYAYEKAAKASGLKNTKISNDGPVENFTFVRKVVHFGTQKTTQVFEMEKPGDLSKGKELLVAAIGNLIPFISRLSKSVSLSNDIITRLAAQFEIQKEKVQELVYPQKQEFIRVLREKFSNYKLLKKQRAQDKWKNHYPFYLVLDFLEPNDLVKFLEINKEMRKMFQKRVYRTIFNNYSQKLIPKQRASIWKNLLEPFSLHLNINELLEKFNEESGGSFAKFQEVIELDVARSFGGMEQEDRDNLQNILKAYAAFDKDIGYVQGINYIAGFLYSVFGNIDDTFQYLIVVMQKYLKTSVYLNFQKLKFYSSRLDQVLDLYRPKLAVHFQNEKIEAPFYSTSWFLTTFISSFRYKERPKLLEKIWDYFLLDGLKVVFKVGLIILMQYETTLLEMNFASVLSFLGDLGKGELSSSMSDIEKKESESEEPSKDIKFILNFEKIVKNLKGFNKLITDLHEGLDVIEA